MMFGQLKLTDGLLIVVGFAVLAFTARWLYDKRNKR
jgi:hypothetical protein